MVGVHSPVFSAPAYRFSIQASLEVQPPEESCLLGPNWPTMSITSQWPKYSARVSWKLYWDPGATASKSTEGKGETPWKSDEG